MANLDDLLNKHKEKISSHNPSIKGAIKIPRTKTRPWQNLPTEQSSQAEDTQLKGPSDLDRAQSAPSDLDRAQSAPSDLDRAQPAPSDLDRAQSDPSVSDRSKSDPSVSDRSKSDPSVSDRSKSDPSASDRSKSDPSVSDMSKFDLSILVLSEKDISILEDSHLVRSKTVRSVREVSEDDLTNLDPSCFVFTEFDLSHLDLSQLDRSKIRTSQKNIYNVYLVLDVLRKRNMFDPQLNLLTELFFLFSVSKTNYISFKVEKLATALKINSDTIKRAIRNLESCKAIECKHSTIGNIKTKFYKLPDEVHQIF